jgi:hypothetical protein
MFEYKNLANHETTSSNPLKFHKLIISCVAIIYLSSLSFFVQASGNANALICSTQLGETVPSCPINKYEHASSFSHVPEIHTSCDSGGFACFEAQTYGTTTDYFTFYDIDANETIKYAITVTPTLRYSDDSMLQQGYKNAQVVTPTDDEIEITEGFNDVISKKQYLDRMLTVTQNSDGSVTDANGNTDFFVEKIKENCLTALDYQNNLSLCAGYLNNSIDDAVNDNARFYAFINALEQLQTVINIVLPEGLDLDDIGKLAEFPLKIMLKDNSIIAINVKIAQGLVEISLNMDASRTSTGVTFAQAFMRGVSRSGSLDEANTIGEMSILPVFCKPVNLSESEYTVVNSIVIRLPDGSERVIFIYAKDTYFYTYQSCG